MSQKNSLMEWLQQIKRLTKEEDYMGLDIVDSVIDSLWIIEKSFVKKYKDMIDDLCIRYHKPNPLNMTKKQAKLEFLEESGMTVEQWMRKTCPKLAESGKCRLLSYVKRQSTDHLKVQLDRYTKANEVLLWQWFEVIDFMYERPELINPNLMDEYIEDIVNRVCKLHRKNNPFENGMKKRFGKFWKDRKGHWRKERRRRF